jgi:hypothetical protein
MLALSILAVPLVGEAQYKAGKVPRVGILNFGHGAGCARK